MKYEIGDDYQDDETTYKTYGISCNDHPNKIEVYNDEELRDKILELLNKEQK